MQPVAYEYPVFVLQNKATQTHALHEYLTSDVKALSDKYFAATQIAQHLHGSHAFRPVQYLVKALYNNQRYFRHH